MSVRTVEARLLITGQDKASAQIAAVAKATAGAAKQIAAVGKAAKISGDIDRLNRSLAATRKAAEDAAGLQKIQGALATARMGFRQAQAEVRRTATALDAARTSGTASAQVIQRLTAEHRNATQAVRATAVAVNAQSRAFEAARAAVNSYGVPIRSMTDHQRALGSSITGTTNAIRAQERALRDLARAREVKSIRQERVRAQQDYREALANRDAAAAEQRRASRRDVIGGAAAVTAGVAAHQGKRIGLAAIESAAEFDYAKRQQVIASDITEAKQKALLLPQAKRIGQETKFTNKDIVEAQTATMASLPIKDVDVKAEVGAAIIDQVRNQAVILGAGMTQTAETVRSFIQSTNKDISTKEKAVAEATRATNLMVKGAKIGGMSADDVDQFVKYGLPTATQAGFSDTTSMALGALARRSGLRGDEAGVFLRAASSKLIAPTQKGREAEIVANIDRSKYVTPGKEMSVDNLAKFSKNRFGKDLNDDQRRRIEDLLDDPEVVGKPDEFTKQVSEVVSESFAKTKSGKTKAQDASKIAKMVGDFYKMSIEATDVEGLLREHMTNPKMTPALRNAFYTDKHGGKAGILATHGDQFEGDRASLEDVTRPENADFSRKKAEYKAAGLGGSIENLKGSWETLVVNIGEANTGLIKFTAEGLASANDMFSNMSTTNQQIVSLGGGAVAAAGGIWATAKFLKVLLGTGNAGALGGAAAAHVKAAAALEAAAVRLGAPKPSDALPEKAKDIAAGGALAASAVIGGVIIGGAAATAFATEVTKNKDFAKAYTGDGTLDDGGMLGADPAGYGFGAGILNAPDHSVRMAPKMTVEAPTAALTLGKDGPRFGLGNGPDAHRMGWEAGIKVIRGVESAMEPPILNPGDGMPGYESLPTVAKTEGTKAGQNLGTGVKDGVAEKEPEVIEQGKSLFEKLKGLFSEGIRIPISLASAEGGGDGGGLIHKASLGGAGGAGDSPGGGSSVSNLLGTGRRSGGTSGGDGGGTGRGGASISALPNSIAMTDAERNTLGLIEKYESGGQNTLNYVGKRQGINPQKAKGYTAQGHFQMLNSNWRRIAPKLGITTPNAMSSSREDQARVALHLLRNGGIGNWSKYNPALRGALSRGEQFKPGLSDEALQKKVAPLEKTMPEGSGMGGAADRMHQAVDRMEKVGWRSHHTVEVTAGAGLNARTTGMRATSSGPVKADVGVSMPQTKDGDWV